MKNDVTFKHFRQRKMDGDEEAEDRRGSVSTLNTNQIQTKKKIIGNMKIIIACSKLNK